MHTWWLSGSTDALFLCYYLFLTVIAVAAVVYFTLNYAKETSTDKKNTKANREEKKEIREHHSGRGKICTEI